MPAEAPTALLAHGVCLLVCRRSQFSYTYTPSCQRLLRTNVMQQLLPQGKEFKKTNAAGKRSSTGSLCPTAAAAACHVSPPSCLPPAPPSALLPHLATARGAA